MRHRVPSRVELIDILDRLTAGLECRVDVSDWAMAIMADKSLGISDIVAWQVICGLSDLSSAGPDGNFLFGPADFEIWRAELRQARTSSHPRT
jgi:hypothetical protein